MGSLVDVVGAGRFALQICMGWQHIENFFRISRVYRNTSISPRPHKLDMYLLPEAISKLTHGIDDFI